MHIKVLCVFSVCYCVKTWMQTEYKYLDVLGINIMKSYFLLIAFHCSSFWFEKQQMSHYNEVYNILHTHARTFAEHMDATDTPIVYCRG